MEESARIKPGRPVVVELGPFDAGASYDGAYQWGSASLGSTGYVIITALAAAPFEAFFFETPPLAAQTVDRPFEWVLVDCPPRADGVLCANAVRAADGAQRFTYDGEVYKGEAQVTSVKDNRFAFCRVITAPAGSPTQPDRQPASASPAPAWGASA